MHINVSGFQFHQQATQKNPQGAFALKTGPLHLTASTQASSLPLQGNPLEALDALAQWEGVERLTRASRVRWALERMPLRVFIEPHGVSANDRETAMARSAFLFSAMQQWTSASQGRVRFQQIERPGGLLEEGDPSVDIHVRWSDETTLGRDFEVGHTNRTVQGKRITQAVITLIRQPVIDGHLTGEQRKKRLYTTMLHETGHALGLEHSDNAADVMYYRGWKRPSLSEGDVQHIQTLYPAQTAFLF